MFVPKLHQVDFTILATLAPANDVAARVGTSHPEVLRKSAAKKLKMTGTKRTPVVLHDNPFVRLVSRPGAKWRVEHQVREHGSREHDNWAPLSRDVDQETASERLLALAQANARVMPTRR
jgi:hypothetical protein